MRFLKHTLFVLLLSSLFACKKNKSNSVDEEQPKITLGPKTVQIDNSTSQIIDTVTESSVLFVGSTNQLENLKVGDIIVSGIAPNAPAGFLRKITGIQKVGNTYSLTTIIVPLVEAFLNLNVDETIPLPAIPLKLTDLVLYDKDGDSSTAFDQVRFNSNINHVPELKVKININKGNLEYAYIGGGITNDITSSITIGGALSDFKKEITVFEKKFGAFIIPSTPIVIVPTLSITLGANGSVSVELTYSQTENGKEGTYLEFKDGSWNPVSENSITQTSNFTGSFGNIEVRSFIKPALNFKFWDLDAAKVSAYLEGYATLTGQVVPYKPCELKAGAKGGIEANLKLFNNTVNLSTNFPALFDDSKVLFKCDSVPPLLPDFLADRRTITAGESVNFADISLGSPTSWNWNFPGGTPATSSTKNPANIYYNTAGTYSVSLTVAKGSESKSVTKNSFIIVNAPAVQLPAVTTSAATGITSNTAQSGGTVTNDGGAAITARGVCWSTGQNPTVANSTTSNGTGTGSFTSSITGLAANTTYYTRAYATNSAGTSYGNQVSFKTQSCTITNPTSESVTIGTQVWMTKNLDVTTYRNGDPIPQVTDPTEWANLKTGAWCYYKNDPAMGATYGKLYNWYAVNDPRGLAPAGWHIPSQAEWVTLQYFLGGPSVAGGAMRESCGWAGNISGPTNSSGWTGLAGGHRESNGHSFALVQLYGYWWSTSTLNPTTTTSYVLRLAYDGLDAPSITREAEYGLSVRCLKD